MNWAHTEPTGGVWRVESVIILGSWFRLPQPTYKFFGLYPNSNRGAIFAYSWVQVCREYVEAASTALVDPWPKMNNYTLSTTYSSDLKQHNQDFMILVYFDMEHEDIAIRVLQSVFWPAAEAMGLTVDRENKTETWEGADIAIKNITDVDMTIAGPCSLRGYAAEFFMIPGVVVPYYGDRLWC